MTEDHIPTTKFVGVIVVETTIIVLLWIFGRVFS